LRRNGEEFPVELSITPFHHSGELVFLGFMRDISDRRNAEAALERRALQAQLIYEVVSFAAETQSFDAALSKCLEAVHTLTGWPIGHVYLLSEDDPPLLLPSDVWFPSSGERFDLLKTITAKTTLSVGEGLPGRVLEAGEPIWVSNVHTDDRFPRAAGAKGLEVTSALGFPIKNGNSIIAIVEFFTPVQSEPDAELILTLRSIGDQVGRVFDRHLTEAKLNAQADHQRLLVAELNHRVKNMLAVVSGIASQTMRTSDSMSAFNQSFMERLNALSQAYGLLASQNWQGTGLKELLEAVGKPYEQERPWVTVDGGDVRISPRQALALSLVLHELFTNSAKYGALSTPQGTLSMSWSVRAGVSPSLRFQWSEGGMVDLRKPTKNGFGSRLIEATITHQLHGTFKSDHGPDGFRYEMEWPIAFAGADHVIQ
jgi:two-component sensor histidine kinase